MKKTYKEPNEVEDNSFSLSTGDLMAGLLFIFILLLMSALLRVQEKDDFQTKIVNQYNDTKQSLYIDLEEKFKMKLPVWKAELDSSTLSIRFQEPSMLFDEGKAELKPMFTDILDDFFPKYIEVLKDSNYRDNIEEIRIEGHTNTNGSYYYNMKLSQDRTRAVLEYCMSKVDSTDSEWLKGLITANGLSFSKPIMVDGKANMELSRRVEFRIRTNAEKKLEDIVKETGN